MKETRDDGKGASSWTEDALKLTLELLAIPSVAGDCEAAMARVEEEFRAMGLTPRRTRKGALVATVQGTDDERQRVVTAHLDTLGAVVRNIKDNGRLRLFALGGYDWRTFEGENCSVHTLDGRTVGGTLLPDHAARHAFSHAPAAAEEAHTLDTMEVRLDVATSSKEETEALGIHPGDIVSYAPRSELTEAGFIKSRFLDDKIGVAILLRGLRELREGGTPLPHTTHFYISNYEELGHGAPAIPPKAEEVAAIDIGVVAEGCASSERAVTILSRDSVTPYDRRMVRQLRDLAERDGIPYRIDAYQNYASDATVCVRSGLDVRALCFGPGAEATHNYERTHADAVDATLRLLRAYLTSDML